MVAAGLLAKKAVERGLRTKPWVKASLAPGSKVVTDYLHDAGLQSYLDQLRFNLVGYGCTTCIGNSGPLSPESPRPFTRTTWSPRRSSRGNRNFEGRINPEVRANYLASPPLVVAYALAGTMDFDLRNEPLGNDQEGQPVFSRTSGPASARSRTRSSNRFDRRCSRASTPRSSRATSMEFAADARRATSTSGTRSRPT